MNTLSRIIPAAGLALAALAIVVPTGAGAQEMSPAMKAQARALMTPCYPDYKKFCSSVPKGNGAILNCLISHKADLSNACQGAMAKLKGMQGGGGN